MENIAEFADDDVYKQFLGSNFDVKAVASSAVQGVAVTEQLAKLTHGITLLDKKLHEQVANHYDDLLSQATAIETLEDVLDATHVRIQILVISTERLRNKVAEPYSKAANQTAMLTRLQQTCDVLRHIIRIAHLSKRLAGQLQGGGREITKAAQNLDELDYLNKGFDLSGIDVISRDLEFVQEARCQVIKQAQQMLESGMATQNQTQVATALQVFYNLKILQPTMEQLLDDAAEALRNDVKDTLDMKLLTQQSTAVFQPKGTLSSSGPGRASMPTLGKTAAFRANLWTSMEKLMDSICLQCNKIQHLHKVLARKRDPMSHVCFLDELRKSGQGDVMQQFWNTLTNVLTEEFAHAAKESTFLKQAFEGEYPKLLRLYNDLWKGLQQFSSSLTVTSNDENKLQTVCDEGGFSTERSMIDPEASLRGTLSVFEEAYLARSLSRLYDSVNKVFPEGSRDPPTLEDIDAIVKIIASEMNVSTMDRLLAKKVARNVAETVKTFSSKCELLVSSGEEAVQVIGPPTSEQTLNATTIQLLHEFHGRISQFLSNNNSLPGESEDIIRTSLKSLETAMESCIQPFFCSVMNAIEAIILTMHCEDFSGVAAEKNTETPSAPCSLYMKELQGFVARIHADHFSLFPDCELVQKRIRQVACRAIELFVRHASLVRPLGDGGKMRLAADFAQMEMAIAPLCQKVGDLGKSYRALRSFRPLLFQTPVHVAQSPVLGDLIPYSVALQFMFARAPPELRSPHEVAGWSIGNYSKWLDQHPLEKERLTLIRGTLEAYVQSVKQKQKKEFCSVYPLIRDLLQVAFQANTL